MPELYSPNPNFIGRAVEHIRDFTQNIIERGPGWKRQAAALTVAQAIHFGLLAGAGVAITEHNNQDGEATKTEQVGHTPHTTKQPSLIEQLVIPPAVDLPPVLSKPIHNKVSDNFDLEAYKPKFVGAYQSTEGLGINVYAATRPGQEASLAQDFQVNPRSIEFVIREITTHIKDAPDNPSKAAIIKNLQDLKTGVDDRVMDLVFDVSPEAGCLDARHQLTALTTGVCSTGVTLDNLETDGSIKWPIIIASGSQIKDVQVTSKEREEFNKTFGLGRGSNYPVYPVDQASNLASPSDQQATVEHELVHGLSVKGLSDDTYKEGDSDHEITAWLLGEDSPGDFDFKGATAPSPNLKDKIINLVETGALKPILSVKK